MHKTRHGFIDNFNPVRDDDRSRSRSASKVQLKVGHVGWQKIVHKSKHGTITYKSYNPHTNPKKKVKRTRKHWSLGKKITTMMKAK